MLTARLVTDAKEWNDTIVPMANAHILQSWEWGAFKRNYGWSPIPVLLCDASVPRAAALVLRRRLPRTPYGVLYVPKGPVLDYGNPALFDATLAALERIARAQRAIFVKIDPDIEKIDREEPPPVRQLMARKWRASQEQIQFRNTVVLDLNRSEGERLAALKPKTRYNIRLAAKRGVRVEQGTLDDLSLFYEMYVETSERDKFVIRPFRYYRDAWGAFLEAGRAQMFLARLGGETIAGIIVFVYGERAWYFYGASRAAHRDAMPNYALQWEAIRWAAAHGCHTYDFWGAPDTLDEHAPMYGVYRFKEGFGGKFTQHIGAYDYVVYPTLYWLYSVVRPRYLARLRAKHRVNAFEQ